MSLFQRLFGKAHRTGARPRRGQPRLELFSLLAVLLVGALAIGATSASAEDDEAPDAQTTPAVIATSGGAGELLDGTEQSVVIQAAEAGPVDAEFEACMREQGIELPGPVLDERSSADEDTAPSVGSAPVDDAFIEAAEQCGHVVEVFTHEAGDLPAVSPEQLAVFHECLSAAGVERPGAAPAQPGVGQGAGTMAVHTVVGSGDPELQAAFEQCATLLPDGVVEFAGEDSE